MDLKLKQYRKIKIKKYFKTLSFFSIYHISKKKSQDWLHIEQKLETLGLNFYKTSNGATVKTIQSSIYKNFDKSFNGTVVVLYPKSSKFEFNFKEVNKQLRTSFICLALKLNNKLYSSESITNLTETSYKKSTFQLVKFLNKHTKTSYIWTPLISK